VTGGGDCFSLDLPQAASSPGNYTVFVARDPFGRSCTSNLIPDSSPEPTATPVPPEIGTRLEISGQYFEPGDIFWLMAYLDNSGTALFNVPLVVVLQVDGMFWFWNDWTGSLDTIPVHVPTGTTGMPIISAFAWPDVGWHAAEDIAFWSALLSRILRRFSAGRQVSALLIPVLTRPAIVFFEQSGSAEPDPGEPVILNPARMTS